MNGRIFLVALLMSAKSMSFFLITELFANGMGAGSNNKKSWIEVTLLPEKTVTIEHLKVTITAEKDGSNEVIEYAPPYPITLSDRLIIAEDKNLGTKKCLSSEQPIMELPRLRIKNARTQKICLQLNDIESCVVIGKKDVFPDGVSLYRSLLDRNEHPHWFKEPCFIGEHMFASPGLTERFCQESREVFVDCPGARFTVFEPHNPALDILVRSNNATVFIKLDDLKGNIPWRAHFCASSKPQGPLCHEITSLIALGGEQLLNMPTWPHFFGAYSSIHFRDVMGNEVKKYVGRQG